MLGLGLRNAWFYDCGGNSFGALIVVLCFQFVVLCGFALLYGLVCCIGEVGVGCVLLIWFDLIVVGFGFGGFVMLPVGLRF